MEDSDDELGFEDARDDIMARAKAAGLKFEVVRNRDDEPGLEAEHSHDLVLSLPNGRDSFVRVLDGSDAHEFARTRFESFMVVGKYAAIYDREEGTLEARVQLGPMYSAVSEIFPELMIGHLPGFEYPSDTGTSIQLGNVMHRTNWRMQLGSDERGAGFQLARASTTLRRILKHVPLGALAITIGNLHFVRHDELVEYLEDATARLFFEIDTRFGIVFELGRRASPSRAPSGPSFKDMRPIRFPRARYSKSAVTIYLYGRSLDGSPLAQYLSYYQAIEFFFPTFTSQAIIKRVRNTLRNPRFDDADDHDIQRLVDLAAGAGSRGMPEREQLSLTLEASMDDADVRAYLEADGDAREFLAKKDGLAGVPAINVANTSVSLTRQLAARIYALRCRVVHAKDVSTDKLAEPLLPYSKDAQRLKHDLAIAVFACQRVIVAGSS